MKRFFRLYVAFSLCWLLLGVKNGYLALWKDEDPEPVHIFPVRIRSLPPADQLALRRGIFAEDLQALLSLLEDYL